MTILWGSGASQQQVKRAVEDYFRRHPPQGGTATDAQVNAAVADYLTRYPPAPGKDGKDATDAQVLDAVATYMAANPPATGPAGPRGLTGADGPKGDTGAKGDQGERGIAGSVGAQGAPGATGQAGVKGDTGPAGVPANTLIATGVVFGQTALVAIALGIRDLPPVAVAGVVPGERYQAFVRGYRINGATTTTVGKPTLYNVLDVTCLVAGQLIASINAPLLAIGADYKLYCDIVKVNAS